MNWEPALHSVFGEISRQLKEKSNLPQDSKLKLVFYIEQESIKVRLIGRSESLVLVTIHQTTRGIFILNGEIGLNRVIGHLDFKNKDQKEKLRLICEALRVSYEKYGHFKY